ncbi:hypothetical protein [Prochlorococcus sp. MIT 1303]|uniref:hypothetical protein n=1 Tax=Prochlorococcus sp. MIT 1303 TaxID=1723647 RepID=UPI0007B3BA0E|nr:hypothetical protein [Prochlorococcus sp. MIT 1303]
MFSGRNHRSHFALELISSFSKSQIHLLTYLLDSVAEDLHLVTILTEFSLGNRGFRSQRIAPRYSLINLISSRASQLSTLSYLDFIIGFFLAR